MKLHLKKFNYLLRNFFIESHLSNYYFDFDLFKIVGEKKIQFKNALNENGKKVDENVLLLIRVTGSVADGKCLMLSILLQHCSKKMKVSFCIPIKLLKEVHVVLV